MRPETSSSFKPTTSRAQASIIAGRPPAQAGVLASAASRIVIAEFSKNSRRLPSNVDARVRSEASWIIGSPLIVFDHRKTLSAFVSRAKRCYVSVDLTFSKAELQGTSDGAGS